MSFRLPIALTVLAISAAANGLTLCHAVEFRSHPPMRPLPVASQRAAATGPRLYVSPAGDDKADGTQSRPWKTVQHAVRQLKPGDTLYLRGGVYYEHVTVTARGTAERPIVIRAYPNELAVI